MIKETDIGNSKDLFRKKTSLVVILTLDIREHY
jgi:hypothetical protein